MKPNTVVQSAILAKRIGSRLVRQRVLVLLAVCVTIGAATTATLGFLADDVQRALDRDVARFLGAPLVLRSNHPVDPAVFGGNWETLTTHASTASFTVGATGPERYHSVALKAVSDGYPVLGQVLVHADGIERVSANMPERGTAWLDRRAMNLLGAESGDFVRIGQSRLRVAAELVFEPDRLTQLQHTLPRVLIAIRDLPAVGLDLDSGRGDFRYLFAGSDAVLAAIETSVAGLGIEVLKPGSGQHPFSRISQRASRFLGMVSVMVLLLCGSACAVLSGSIVRRYAPAAALLRCMGVDRHSFALALVWLLGILALVSTLIGALAGWAAQPLFARLLEPHLTLEPGPPDLTIVALTAGFSLLTLVSFVFPRLRSLSRISPIAALTGSVSVRPRIAGVVVASTVCAVTLLWLFSDNARLTVILVAAVTATAAAAWVFGWLIGVLAGQLYRFTRGWLRIALRSLGRSAGRYAVPMTTVALAVMMFLSTAMLRDSFLDTYHEQRFDHDGNYLFTGIPGNEMPGFRKFMADRDIDLRGLHPSVRAQLTAINDVPFEKALDHESDTREEARSPVRLSFADVVPANNTLHEGRWPAPGSGSVSVDSEVMSDLGLEIGDRLTFTIGDVQLRTTISSRRGYVGGGSSFMFWFMFAPDALEGLPQEYLGGFHLAGDSRATLAALSAEFPDIVVTDLEQHLSRVRDIMVALTRMFNALIALLLLAATMVLVATAVSAVDEKRRTGGLLRAIGATCGQIRRMWLVERAMVGFVSALIGVLGAHLLAELIFRYQFGMPYATDWVNYTMVPLGFASAFAMLEFSLSNPSLRQPPLKAMQLT